MKDIPVRVAFEATDAYGNPVEISGRIINRKGDERLTFATEHEGKGSFTYRAGTEEDHVEVIWNEKKFRFDLPEAREQGFVCSVDNLSSPDSLLVTVQKNSRTPGNVLGMGVLSGGKLYHFCMLTVTRNRPVRFKLDKQALPAGVAQAVWFDHSGSIIADRLMFIGQPDTLSVTVQSDKSSYQPYDSIRLDFEVKDAKGRPIQASLSVSVRDGWQEVENRHSLLTDLLLMSDIKGYVHQPSWYFESDDLSHRRALDDLLMVQGWRRYDWERMAGRSPFELKYMPEQGIELHGKVVSMVRSKPRANVEVTAFLASPGDDPESKNQKFFDLFTTDSLGRFSFVSQIEGKWNLILAATEKGKKKDYRIVLDRVFAPSPRMYPLAEMDDIQDRDIYIGNDIHDLMMNMNPSFYPESAPSGREYLLYKGRLVLFVINYERTFHEEMDFNKYRNLSLESIKSVYISEDLGTMCRYADPMFTPMNIDKIYGCVVLIETLPEEEVSVKGAKGVRKTWLEGYSKVKEFYLPDYRILPREGDYRRTLYWNPELMPDKEGHATIQFYNNSRCRRPRVSVNVLDADGRIGVFEH